ncbi:TonB-dependent receptor domain-containing protein [Novosphingobium rosa]|uniref:TonB-dependent receptor domain-containing protein n=1 Tax=Novosphingobium rosa TaxID=76978 RepID=UPI001FE11F47|nr:TonB-dependent receptor [Novosphingobium rosa]
MPRVALAGQALPFDIPAMPLSEALVLFAKQSHRAILFAPTDARGRRSVRLHARLDPDKALAQLLKGSGWQARAAPGGAYLLEATPMAEPRTPAPRPRPIFTDAETLAPAQIAVTSDIVVVGTPGGGQRRQQAAFAVTTIDRPAIDQLAPSSTAEVLKLVPGLTVETSGGKNGANIFVRGYPSGGDAEYVTLQSEGVPFFPPATLSFLENSQLYQMDETVQRVEAVRGGTGALFASGQPGVTVNLVQREGGDHREGMIKATLISDGETRADGYLSGPLGPRTRAMIGGYVTRGDGIRSPGFDADRGGQITANLRQDLGSGSLLVFGRYLNDRSQWLLPIPLQQNGQSISAYPGFSASSGTLAGPDTQRGTLGDGTRYDLADGRGARIVQLGGNLELRPAHGLILRDKISWLSGHADTTGLVPDNTPPQSAADLAAGMGGRIGSLATATGQPMSANQSVVEAGIWTITKRIDALVNDATLEWTTGASKATVGIYATTYGSRDRWNIGNDLLLTAEPHARRVNMVLADGRAVTRDGFTSGASFLVDASYSGNDLAFYGVEELKVTDRLRIDGGLRHQSHAVDGTIADTRPAGPGGLDGDPRTLYDNNDVVFTGTATPLRYRGGAWSWTLGANYAPTTHLSAFMRFSRGNSFPFFDNLRDGITLTPQVDTIEGGVKLSTTPFSLYATLFHNRFQGLVTTVITEGAPMASVGGASATGVELEGQWHPLPAISIAFSGSWLDAHYRHFFTDDGLTDLSGNRVQRQPQWQGRITPSWNGKLGRRKASLFTTISYMGDRWSDVQNQQLLPHFVTLDAGASLDLTQRLRLRVRAENITNTIGLTEGNPRTLGAQPSGAMFARPILGRSVAVSASYGF